jgi:general secretion pathway protein H
MQKGRKNLINNALRDALRAPQGERLKILSHAENKTIQGFTLVEILIVMLIISIVASVAALTITTNQNKNIENFTHQLVNIIQLSCEEAMLRPATLGLAFTSNTYQFYQFQKKWIPLTDKIYGKHSFSSSIKLSLKVQNKTVPLDGKPYLIISTSGDISPFVILIGKQNHSPLFKITGETNGNIKSEEYHADEE